MQGRIGCVFAFGLMAALAAAAWGTPVSDRMPVIYPAGSEPQPDPSPVWWEGGVAHFGDVLLDSATKTVMMTGWVNQTDGLIEVLACGAQGKVHESVLVTPVNALDLQSACLLAGMKAGKPMKGWGIGPPEGSPVEVWVEWKAGGETVKVRAETMALDLRTDGTAEEGPWVFTGSKFEEGRFCAFDEDSLIVTYWDPNAIINLGDPRSGDDQRFVANAAVIPPLGTPVTVYLQPVK